MVPHQQVAMPDSATRDVSTDQNMQEGPPSAAPAVTAPIHIAVGTAIGEEGGETTGAASRARTLPRPSYFSKPVLNHPAAAAEPQKPFSNTGKE